MKRKKLLRKKTQKKLRRLVRTAGMVGGALALELLIGMAGALAERNGELLDRIARAPSKPGSRDGARGARVEEVRERALPRTEDQH